MNDGFIGWDKFWHAVLHCGIAIVNFWTGATLSNTVLTSNAIGILTEYFHAMHWRRIGFSCYDVLWNNVGMMIGIGIWKVFIVS